MTGPKRLWDGAMAGSSGRWARIVLAVLACGAAASGGAAARPRAAKAAAPGLAPMAADAVLAPHAMVAAADPRAVAAGLAVLRAGGTAADAAVSVQAVLGLVEPQSSGLAGGAFMTFLEGRTGKLSVYDGRETAPAAASADLFLGPDGRELGFGPGDPLRPIDGRFRAPSPCWRWRRPSGGRRPWSTLFAEGERLAREGFRGGRAAGGGGERPLPAGHDGRRDGLLHQGRRRAGAEGRRSEEPRLCPGAGADRGAGAGGASQGRDRPRQSWPRRAKGWRAR